MNILLAIQGNEATQSGSEPAVDAALTKVGQQQYMLCGACHGQRGEGTAAGPPLANSEWVNGPVENLINIQLRGLIGPIKVNGQEYNFPGGMQPMAFQSDEQIAGVLSYIRSNLGNNAPPVSPAEVAALRSEVGKPQVTVDDLIAPEPVKKSTSTEVGEPVRIPDKYADMDSSLGIPFWVGAGIFLFVLVCLIGLFKK